MQARMKNPGVVIPDAMTAIRALNEAIKQGGDRLDLRVRLRQWPWGLGLPLRCLEDRTQVLFAQRMAGSLDGSAAQ
jgi:hypothetical protein